MDFFSSAQFSATGHSRSMKNGTNVVGLLNAILSVPRDIVLVGKDVGTQDGAVVGFHTNQHQSVLNLIRNAHNKTEETNIPSLANLASDLELKRFCDGCDCKLVINHDDVSTTVRVLGGDMVIECSWTEC